MSCIEYYLIVSEDREKNLESSDSTRTGLEKQDVALKKQLLFPLTHCASVTI